MNFLHSMDVSASGMTAERFRMDTISQNIANANTTKADGTPYCRQMAVITPTDQPEFVIPVGLEVDDDPHMIGGGVQVGGVIEDTATDFKWVYDPENPKAEQEGMHKGYVAMPNVDIITEMTNMIAASRAFEANATAIEAVKSMANKALEIDRT